jgi:hypothetical protein
MEQRNPSADEAVCARRAALLYRYVRDRYERYCGRLKDGHYQLPDRYSVDRRPGPEADRRPSVWVRLVRACRGRGIDTNLYVWWSLDMNRLWPGDPPEPAELLQPGRLEAFLADRVRERYGVLLEYSFQLNHLKLDHQKYKDYGHSDIPAMLLTLATENSQMSPLYRYCTAWEYSQGVPEFERVAAATVVRAALLYQSQRPHYDATEWSKIIPPHFPAASARVQDEVIGM